MVTIRRTVASKVDLSMFLAGVPPLHKQALSEVDTWTCYRLNEFLFFGLVFAWWAPRVDDPSPLPLL